MHGVIYYMSRKIIQYQDDGKKETNEKKFDEKVLITTYHDKEVALLIKENRLRSLYTIENASKIGNIYVGKVKNVVKNLEACFVEIANKEVAYLPFNEAKNPLLMNRKFDGRILEGDELLVQTQRDALKTKQASLTTKISVSSENFVFTYEEASIGVSLKLKKDLREQIKECLNELESQNIYGDTGFEVSCIVRTEAGMLFNKNKTEFIEQYNREKSDFIQLLNKSIHTVCFTCVKSNNKPFRTILDNFTISSHTEIITDLYEAYTGLQGYCENIRYYEDDFSLIKLYGLEGKIQEALHKKVWMSSGGYLVIEQTECLTSIDVNSGKLMKGTEKEATIWKLNEEAAKEAAIQIRLRNLSGIIIIDFINMESKEQEERLLKIMKELVKNDPIHTSVIDITPLGLMEITRKKVNKSLIEQFS